MLVLEQWAVGDVGDGAEDGDGAEGAVSAIGDGSVSVFGVGVASATEQC